MRPGAFVAADGAEKREAGVPLAVADRVAQGTDRAERGLSFGSRARGSAWDGTGLGDGDGSARRVAESGDGTRRVRACYSVREGRSTREKEGEGEEGGETRREEEAGGERRSCRRTGPQGSGRSRALATRQQGEMAARVEARGPPGRGSRRGSEGAGPGRFGRPGFPYYYFFCY